MLKEEAEGLGPLELTIMRMTPHMLMMHQIVVMVPMAI
jgi:hypothetical protein